MLRNLIGKIAENLGSNSPYTINEPESLTSAIQQISEFANGPHAQQAVNHFNTHFGQSSRSRTLLYAPTLPSRLGSKQFAITWKEAVKTRISLDVLYGTYSDEIVLEVAPQLAGIILESFLESGVYEGSGLGSPSLEFILNAITPLHRDIITTPTDSAVNFYQKHGFQWYGAVGVQMMKTFDGRKADIWYSI